MEWFPRVLKQPTEGKHVLPKSQVSDDPLKPFTVTMSEGGKVKKLGTGNATKVASASGEIKSATRPKSVSTSWGGLDPLSAALNQSEADPLSLMQPLASESPTKVAPSKEKSPLSTSADSHFIDDDFELWSAKKSSILSKYTTSEKLSIKTSFLTGGNSTGPGGSGVRTLQNTSVAEKVKHRLEQLDDFDEGSVKEMLNLSQQEYVNRIEELNCALQESWEQDQRVKALKIAIQCAKLLADVSVIQFYPSKFVLVTDILDNFGSLVYKRIHSKAESPLALESAKETCRNWFFKIASIRELIPRFYVEAAILKTYGFILNESDIQLEYSKSLKRLTKMVRGLGDPLVAMYARAYLCRIAVQMVPNEKSIFKENFSDFFLTYSQFGCAFVESVLSAQRLDYSVYFTLYTPALDWVLQCLTHKALDSVLTDIVTEFRNKASSGNNSGVYALVLNSILTTFRPNFITSRAKEFLEMVKNCGNEDQLNAGFPKHVLVKNLGVCFILSDNVWMNADEGQKLMILNDVWKIVTKFKPSDYISCADVWIEFVVQHFGPNEINTLLKDIIKHMQPDRAFEDHYNQLISIVTKISKFSNEDFSAFFSMDSFMPFLDMLQKESVKVETCKIIVKKFIQQFSLSVSDSGEPAATVSDPVILNSLTYLCKTMHDSMNALTLEDERRQVSALIIDFLRVVSFQRDLESHLNFLVESRANYSNLEPVIAFLVHGVNSLAMETRQIVKGHHTKKTTAFVRACLSYSYITIPSLDDHVSRLQLYFESTQVALVNACLPQTDAFLKAAISLLPQLPNSYETSDGRTCSNEPFFISYVADLLSLLIIVPDHPEQEPLYLFKGLLNVINDHTFDSHSDAKAYIYLDLLTFLSHSAQETYPYHVDKVDSNDTLYGNDDNFMSEIKVLSSQVVEQILAHLMRLGDEKQFKRQAHLALEFFYKIIVLGDIRKMAKLGLNLWQLAHKHSLFDAKQTARSVNFVRRKSVSLNDNAYQELAQRMQQMVSKG